MITWNRLTFHSWNKKSIFHIDVLSRHDSLHSGSYDTASILLEQVRAGFGIWNNKFVLLYVSGTHFLLTLQEVSKSLNLPALLVPILYLEIRACPSKRSFRPLIKKCVIIPKPATCVSLKSCLWKQASIFTYVRKLWVGERRKPGGWLCPQSGGRSLTRCYCNGNTGEERAG